MLARLFAYVGTLALLAILGVHLWDQLPELADAGPAAPAEWSTASRWQPAFAMGKADPSDKTATYEALRHPAGGRKDIFRWGPPGLWPVAELEIYRPGTEIAQSRPVISELAGRMGAERQTTQNLTVHAVDAERGLLLIKGAVPGPKGGVVLVKTAAKGA